MLCQDLGLKCNLWLLFCKLLRGAVEVDLLRVCLVHLGRSTMLGWYKACQIGKSEQQVHLQPCVAFGVIWVQFWLLYLVSSLQYQLIGKLLGSGSFPHGRAFKVDRIFLHKVDK